MRLSLVDAVLRREDVSLIEPGEYRLVVLAPVVLPPKFVHQQTLGLGLTVGHQFKNLEIFDRFNPLVIQSLPHAKLRQMPHRHFAKRPVNALDVFEVEF